MESPNSGQMSGDFFPGDHDIALGQNLWQVLVENHHHHQDLSVRENITLKAITHEDLN